MADQWKGEEHRFKYILDVNVGTGDALNRIMDRIPKNVKVTGIDTSKHFVSTAKELFLS